MKVRFLLCSLFVAAGMCACTSSNAERSAPHTIARETPVGIAVGHLSLDKRDEGSSFSDVALLRASILETVSAIEAVEVVEIPEEPLTTLAPRPELAEQGVRFLIVGSARLRPSPQFSSVSLQVVDTESGAVKLVSTAHHRDISLAAVEAGRDIAERFREVL